MRHYARYISFTVYYNWYNHTLWLPTSLVEEISLSNELPYLIRPLSNVCCGNAIRFWCLGERALHCVVIYYFFLFVV